MKISCSEIREKFLKYFVSKNHLRISGSSIIPNNDPTLLYINSGMAPLKKFFTGEETPPSPNLCNIQPCIRTIDIDEVGDRHHLTGFEMLGSWSINNYFKRDAISLAYELLVDVFKLPKERLYATVFEGSKELNLEPDHESAKVWEEVGLAKDHIVFSPFEDNFWGPAGETGPCGPCTEIFYDTGDEFGESYHTSGNFDTKKRYIEIWNAGVFMQLYKNSDGSYDQLKFKSVDTGAGIERLAMTLNGYTSAYDVDFIKPIKDEVVRQAELCGGTLSEREQRIITDHCRTSTFILGEGILPSNDGRGYIPRRLIRKCIGIVTKNKLFDFNFTHVIEKVIGIYGEFYSHMNENKDKIIAGFEKERQSFEQVLRDGFKKLEKMAGKDSFVISGKDTFLLVSTYGIPIELIKEYVSEKGGSIDEKAYLDEFEQHREISRSSVGGDNKSDKAKLSKNLDDYSVNWESINPTVFVGYEFEECDAGVISLIDPKERAAVTEAKAGDSVIVITDKTCFYAESGGQVNDIGVIKGNGFTLEIVDVQKNEKFVYMHLCKVVEGNVSSGTTAHLTIDGSRRKKIRANHSAVHLLQSALRSTLGDTVKQAGSLVEAERLRFDFVYENKLTDETINQVELLVNKFVQTNAPVNTKEMSVEEATKQGALALFEEKYGDTVRMVEMSDVSKELCGGTHVRSTGDIGLFKILSEGSTGRGIRRITALTGLDALEYVQQQIKMLDEVTAKLKVPGSELIKKIDSLLEAPKAKKVQSAVFQLAPEEIKSKSKVTKDGVNYICEQLSFFSDEVRDEALRVCEVINGVVCFLGVENEQVKVVVAVNKKITGSVNANVVMKEIVKLLDGRGGGQPHLAQGGGSKVKGLDDVLGKFESFITAK